MRERGGRRRRVKSVPPSDALLEEVQTGRRKRLTREREREGERSAESSANTLRKEGRKEQCKCLSLLVLLFRRIPGSADFAKKEKRDILVVVNKSD